MKQLKISLTGHVIRWAARTFVIEVPDNLLVETLDQKVLETLADEAQIGWEFGTEGYVETTDLSIEDMDVEADLPVIPFSAIALPQERVAPENRQDGPA